MCIIKEQATPSKMASAYLTKNQRSNIIENYMTWYQDCVDDDPKAYEGCAPQERLTELKAMNNTKLRKFVLEDYGSIPLS